MTGSRGRRVLGSPPPCSPEFGREVTSCSFHVKGEPRVGGDVSLLERSAPTPAPSQPHVVGTRGDSHRLFCREHLRFPLKSRIWPSRRIICLGPESDGAENTMLLSQQSFGFICVQTRQFHDAQRLRPTAQWADPSLTTPARFYANLHA